MSLENPHRLAAVLLVFASALCTSLMVKAQYPEPLVSEDTLTRVSDHVYALVGFPNIAFVVGNKATLVVDTGLGPRNGATVVKVAQKLAKGPSLYLTTTHYHSEHTTGEQAFPPNTLLIRPSVQQEDLDRGLAAHMERFRAQSAQNKELLQEVKLRAPDILFDRELKLDLGGVTTRLFWLGAAHTEGDELVFVEPDSVLIPGDIVQSKLFPMLPDPKSSLKGWLAILDQLAALHPRLIVPDHGALGEGSLIEKERATLTELQQRALDLKREGKSADDAGQLLSAEFHAKYPDFGNFGLIPNAVKKAYAESQ